MMEDEHKLKRNVSKMYPDLPYFMFDTAWDLLLREILLQNMEKNLQESQSVVQLVISRGATEAESALLLAAVAEGKREKNLTSFLTADLMG